MILYLDQGNTALKWRLCSSAACAGVEGRDDDDALMNLHRALSNIGHRSVDEVWLANVAGVEKLDQLTVALQKICKNTIRPLSVERHLAGVTPAYKDLSSLGVDRWLTMLAAHQDYVGASLIISLGTALTVDLLDASGRHLGGLIAPGWQIVKSTLQHRVADIVAQPSVLNFAGLGASTEDCVQNGASFMVLSFIERAIEQFGGIASTTILCGGDAVQVAGFVNADVVVRETLVLDGICVARRAYLEAADKNKKGF